MFLKVDRIKIVRHRLSENKILFIFIELSFSTLFQLSHLTVRWIKTWWFIKFEYIYSPIAILVGSVLSFSNVIHILFATILLPFFNLKWSCFLTRLYPFYEINCCFDLLFRLFLLHQSFLFTCYRLQFSKSSLQLFSFKISILNLSSPL